MSGWDLAAGADMSGQVDLAAGADTSGCVEMGQLGLRSVV